MQRHTGGVQGTVLFRGYCPVCFRGVAGGNVERGDLRGKRISLRPHKRRRVTHEASPAELIVEWCPGGRAVVPRDDDLTDAWGQQKRAADARQLRELADRAARAAATARRVAPANDPQARWRLLTLAENAENLAATATELAGFVEGQ